MRHKSAQKKAIAAIFVLLSLLLSRYVYNSNFTGIRQFYTGGDLDETVSVTKVIDGDTIELDNGTRLRYIGIDTPEIHHPAKGLQYYGPQAKEFNKKLVLYNRVRLEFDSERFDKYGRTLAYVYLENGTFVNAELVRQGYARAMMISPNTKYAGLVKQLEEEAKREKRGLWGKN